MNKICKSDIDDLALGAIVLGSGGGGDPEEARLITHELMNEIGELPLVNLHELPDDAHLISSGYMGSPMVPSERLSNGTEYDQHPELYHKLTGNKLSHLIAFEIGGTNAFTPLLLAARKGIPLVNADLEGRAYPELQMTSAFVHQLSATPAFLSNNKGHILSLMNGDAKETEDYFRSLTVEMGSWAAFSIYPMTGAEAKKVGIPGSYSRAIAIGKAIREANESQQDPVSALLNATSGEIIASGIISDVTQKIEHAFTNGSFTIESSKGNINTLFQNEYLASFLGSKPLASVPDIIIPIEQETAKPVPHDLLKYGIRVHLVKIPGPAIWKTPEGLAIAGPKYFGIDIDYLDLFGDGK